MPKGKRRILCAEAHEDTFSLIRTMLEQEGHELKAATSVSECLSLASTEEFDLFMLNDNYVDGSSIELCRALRKLTPETPILFFSAYAFAKDRLNGLEAGAEAYLIKPDDILQIADTIKGIFSPQGQRSETGAVQSN